MRELATYSIETDQVVLLVFTNGQRVRVPIADVQRWLTPAEFTQVRSGLKLRRNFLSHHMPKTAVALAAGGLLALCALTGRPLALWWAGAVQPDEAGPRATPATYIVRNLPQEPDPTHITPTPLAAVTPAATPATPAALVPAKPARRKPKPAAGQVARVPAPSMPKTDQVLPIPTVLPLPGDVLGEHTGPNEPTPTPVPTPAPSPTPEVSPSPTPEPLLPPSQF